MKRLGALIAAFLLAGPLHAGQVPVRFAEGITHGFLVLRNAGGKVIAHGDLLQTWRDGEVDKQMIFHFKDGSVFDENVSFTQRDVFVVKKYAITTTGPAFKDDTEISLDFVTGAYRVSVKDRKSGKTDVDDGKLELPPDTYNGMIQTLVKNLPKGKGETMHMVTFAPKPRVIELEAVLVGEDKIKIGDLTKGADHYVLKFHLGPLLGVLAKITGRKPDDGHIWVARDHVPSFVGYEGALSDAEQHWKIEMVSPRPPR